MNYYSHTDLVVDSWHILAYIPDDDGDGLNNSVDQCPDGQSDWTSDSGTDFDGDGCRDIDEDDDDDNDGFWIFGKMNVYLIHAIQHLYL